MRARHAQAYAQEKRALFVFIGDNTNLEDEESEKKLTTTSKAMLGRNWIVALKPCEKITRRKTGRTASSQLEAANPIAMRKQPRLF